MSKPLIAFFMCALLSVSAALAGQQAGPPKSDSEAKPAKKNAESYSTTAAKAQFMRETGYRNGRPGYVVAYRKALACGGAADDISNMEWLTVAEAKAKDKADRSKGCK